VALNYYSMKAPNKKMNKQSGKQDRPKSQISSDKKGQASKEKASTWTKQYPAKVGYHGTDDEKNLSPEE
jgi:hypothetical protein